MLHPVPLYNILEQSYLYHVLNKRTVSEECLKKFIKFLDLGGGGGGGRLFEGRLKEGGIQSKYYGMPKCVKIGDIYIYISLPAISHNKK